MKGGTGRSDAPITQCKSWRGDQTVQRHLSWRCSSSPLLCLCLGLVSCSVTQPVPRGIILRREQLSSRWVEHVGRTRSDTQRRVGFSEAHDRCVQARQISGRKLDKPGSLSLTAHLITQNPLPQTHRLSTIEWERWYRQWNTFIHPRKTKKKFPILFTLLHFICASTIWDKQYQDRHVINTDSNFIRLIKI